MPQGRKSLGSSEGREEGRRKEGRRKEGWMDGRKEERKEEGRMDRRKERKKGRSKRKTNALYLFLREDSVKHIKSSCYKII